MSDDPISNPMSEPEPMDDEEKSGIITKIMTGLALSLGGVLVFQYVLMPRPLMGAMRSARLVQETRQQEIQQAIDEQEKPSGVTAPFAASKKPSKNVRAAKPSTGASRE
jgi:hypothetical protein